MNEDANTTISEYSKSSFLTSDFEFEDENSKLKKKRRIKVKTEEIFLLIKMKKLNCVLNLKIQLRIWVKGIILLLMIIISKLLDIKKK